MFEVGMKSAQDIVANSSEIVYEGKLKVGTDRRKVKDR
jgi:hypothetical protein